jgi:lipoprotein-anchoring transpeptidase ErfK/SrfK
VTLTVTPASGAKRVPVSAEVGLNVAGGAVSTVTLTRAGSGKQIQGSVREDGTSWVPDEPLRYGTTYTATVTARSADGARTATKSTTFTTMGQPGRETGTGLYLFTGDTYGVAVPIVIEFNPPVPTSAQAAVQRRLFVSSTPSQPGVWHWASGSQVWYRPPQYWQPGTTVTVRAALQGVPMGGGYYGDVDRSATVRIGQKVFMKVDNATKSMRVYVNDKLVRRIPVSLGKHSTPSSSGHLVVMSKAYSTVFDTTNEGPGGYRVSVNYAMRLTWGGEFIHAAPWSVGDQGYRNVSHGCVNMSTPNARWLFGVAHVGDPVDVRGTERQVVNGNGWTAWNVSWAEYIKGSALPVPADLAAGVTNPAPSRAAFR